MLRLCHEEPIQEGSGRSVFGHLAFDYNGCFSKAVVWDRELAICHRRLKPFGAFVEQPRGDLDCGGRRGTAHLGEHWQKLLQIDGREVAAYKGANVGFSVVEADAH